MRREFTPKTKEQAFERAKHRCEGILPDGRRCNVNLEHRPKHFDHRIPDWIGGDNSLTNCAVLCVPCHEDKTRKIDIPIIAKSKRVRAKHLGIRKRSRFPGSRDSKFKKRVDGTVVLR